MSAKRSQPLSFASKSMFDVLGSEDVDVSEEEEEVPASSSSVQSPKKADSASTLSKSAKKKLAKQAARAAQGGAAETETSKGETPKVNGNTALPNGQIEDSAARTGKAQHKGNSSSGTAEPSSRAAVSDVNQPPIPPQKDAPKQSSPVEGLKSLPAQSAFAPALPESLPQPTANQLPANRKRKPPGDFTPTGPRDMEKPTSPTKIGVKFSDGVAPGDGEAGELTMKAVTPPKNQNVVERTVWTFIMIGGFITLLCLGHPYMILLVMLCQTLVYKEVTALFQLRDHGLQSEEDRSSTEDRWSKTINWYFFVVANYFLYGESIIYYFKHIVFVDAYFIPFARNHRFISFMLYVVGFVAFVGNLKRQYLRQQFALFCWVHISLFLIVVSSHFIVNNILEGLIWFFVPASLVICNDVMAYICGKLFGKTPLIKLSPKKTVEGFVGAFHCTLIFGLAWGTFFMRFPYMICPARDLGTNVLSRVECRLNPVFIYRDYIFTGPVRQILQTVLGRAPPAVPYAPFQIHLLVMATFASLVAPFGGFFASGFKRAFNIKDFGHSIPGHGGMTDRMDCQFMMGMFSYVYYSSLIRVQHVTVGSILQTIVMSLSAGEQLELLGDLKRFLEGQGVKVK